MNTDWLLLRLKPVAEYSDYSVQLAGIEGAIYDIQGFALMLMAESGPGIGEIVEIGSFTGKSTCWMALGSKKLSREKVTAIDPFTGSPEHQEGQGHEVAAIVNEGSTHRIFLENIANMGVDDHILPIVAKSEEAVTDWNKPIRLLFIDGDHSYEASRLDFELWSPFVVSGGLIAFHDIGRWPGVTDFYKELMSTTTNYKEVMSVVGLNTIQKL
jgi:predicted O-methyltransferase YrrM